MAKILYWNNGIEINYNGHENTKEILFELDDNNKICNTFKIFPTQFSYDCDIYDNEITNITNFINIDKGFLFYSFIYQKSIGHFIGQTLPKLVDYLDMCIANNEDIPLLIPRVFYNVITKDILDLLNIKNIIILEDKTIYIINNLITIPHYETVPAPPIDKHIKIYNKIRETLKITNDCEKNKKIYLRRDNCKSIEHGNDETGIFRQIMNEYEFVKILENRGFEIITLGKSNICEKCNLLSNADTIITQLGGNCYNFIFSNAPKKIIYLSNQEMFGYEYFTTLLDTLNNTNIENRLLRFESLHHLCDPTNDWNSPFYVDIKQILDLLDNNV